MYRKTTNQSGSTLVELITWMALSSLLLLAVGGIFFSTSKLWIYGNQQYDAQQAARLVMNLLTSELRYASSQTNVGFETPPVGSVNANKDQSIMFTSHKDGKKTITYYLDKDNKQLYKVLNGAYSTPQLVLPETVKSGVFFIPPTNGKVFDISPVVENKSTNVTIHLIAVVLKGHKLPISDADSKAAANDHKTFTLETTITLLDSFLK